MWASDVLRAIFADAYTTEAAYMRWRVRAPGAVSYRSVLQRLWTLLFHGRLSMAVMRTSVYTHLHDGFEIGIQDMSSRARRMLLEVLEHGIDNPGEYTCASESFVQRAVFLNFATKPGAEGEAPAFAPVELFARLIDYDVMQAADVVTMQLCMEILSHFATAMLCTQRELAPEQREFLEWLVEHTTEVYFMVARSPAMVLKQKGVIHSAWCARERRANSPSQ